MKLTKAQAFIAAMCVAAMVAASMTEWGALFELPTGSLLGFAALVGMGLMSESLAVRLTVGNTAGNTSITFIPLLASVQLFGPAAAVALMATTGAFGETIIRKKEPVRALFNIAQWTFSSAVAGWVFTLLGGVALEGVVATDVGPRLVEQLWPFVAFGLSFLALNHAAVSLVIALSQEIRFNQVWAQMLGHSGASFQDLLVSPIAIAVAFLYIQLGVMGIVVVLLPILFIRRSYHQTQELREANSDLLKVLVKAIETRDPYTSGHSLRVSHLAKRISEELGLSPAAIQSVENAALLHDVGKIDAVYTAILSKPDALTCEERAVIETHVTKGEEFLRNLSSVPEDIILSVRHHHEREDGGGYPDGLAGSDIPLGAKIIGVCDAVDAMLSDRPYRKALSVPVVLEQLRSHTGTQFDDKIVDCILSTGLIDEYASIVRASTNVDPAPLPASLPPFSEPAVVRV